MQYRRDIDGLRAVAVGSVVLFHAGLSTFGGGYVGVDVFFVISGYLITSIVADDIRHKRFSILTFYERRVRRIFPALFVMLFATTIAAAVLLLPRDFKEYAESMVSSTVFVSNIYFWRISDYFAGPSHLKPLLHTWSLSVEEQFYIFFPPLLFILDRRFGGRYLLWLVPLALLSFLLSVVSTGWKPTAAFFLTPTRVWELLIGSLLALGAVPALPSYRLREAVAAIGLALIAWAVVMFNDQTAFPGAAALAPCLGAACIIHAGNAGSTIVGRVLGLRPVVFLGLISYSLYLWHWPFLSLVRYWAAEPLSPGLTFAALVLALLASVLSWRFVELPFRDRRVTATRAPLFQAAGIAMAIALLIGAFGHFANGWPSRFPSYQSVVVPGRELLREGTCFLRAEQAPTSYAGIRSCGIDVVDGQRKVLIWGDSFAAHLIPGLMPPANAGLSVFQYTASGCPPIVGRSFANRPLCTAFNDRAVEIIGELKPHVVVLAARWELYFGATSDASQLAATIRRIQSLGTAVLLVGQGPSFDFDNPNDFVFRTGRMEARPHAVNALNSRLSQLGAATFIDPMSIFCAGERCALKEGASDLFFDGGHFSKAGSQLIAKALVPQIQRVLALFNAPSSGSGSVVKPIQ